MGMSLDCWKINKVSMAIASKQRKECMEMKAEKLGWSQPYRVLQAMLSVNFILSIMEALVTFKCMYDMISFLC